MHGAFKKSCKFMRTPPFSEVPDGVASTGEMKCFGWLIGILQSMILDAIERAIRWRFFVLMGFTERG